MPKNTLNNPNLNPISISIPQKQPQHQNHHPSALRLLLATEKVAVGASWLAQRYICEKKLAVTNL